MYLDDFIKRAHTTLFGYPEPLRYLKARAISDTDIKRYQLGFVRVARIANNNSEDYKTIHESTYGFRSLQNRILFPLKNILGHVNGVTVRDIDKKVYAHYFLGEAKETGTFFGLYEALPYITSSKKVFVHEGAFNAISFGTVFPNVVASLTSFLNEQQVETLRFFADKIILIYDKDKSGIKGVQKLRSMYGSNHIEYVSLGESDANACHQFMGQQRFEKFLRSKVPAMLQDDF